MLSHAMPCYDNGVLGYARTPEQRLHSSFRAKEPSFSVRVSKRINLPCATRPLHTRRQQHRREGQPRGQKSCVQYLGWWTGVQYSGWWWTGVHLNSHSPACIAKILLDELMPVKQ